MPISPKLSVIVVFFDMAREAPRTLFTLSSNYQRGVSEHDYEVIVVDAGSEPPLPDELVASYGSNFRLVRAERAQSPVQAINKTAESARGDAIALCIDGARMLSPGIIGLTLRALKAYHNPVVATVAYHLGPALQNQSMLGGYNQIVEDELLNSVGWHADGYELFRIASFAGSSSGGWFSPLCESNCVTILKDSWNLLGGLHEGFVSAGGGLVNLDFYSEACSRMGELVVLLGEGTFHQFHGGVATNVPKLEHPWPVFHEEFRLIRGRDFSAPSKKATYLGSIPHQAIPFVVASATQIPTERPTQARSIL